MREEVNIHYSNRADNYTCLDLNELIANLDSYSFKYVYLNPRVNIGSDRVYYFTDKDHQIVTGEFVMIHSFLAFDEEYYKTHFDEVNDALVHICRNVKSSYFSLDGILVNHEIIEALCDNPNIKTLCLGSMFNSYTLTKEDYELIKKSTIEKVKTEGVEKDLEEIFDEKISYNDDRPLVMDQNYKKLNSYGDLTINRSLTDEELYNLKFVKKGMQIEFEGFYDYANIFRAIKRLQDLGKECSVTIFAQYKDRYDYKNELNEYIFTHLDVLDYDVSVGVGYKDKYSIKDYAKYEKRLIDMIRPAINLSPLEKFLYAYNITAKFKKYKENNENKNESRSLYEIMDGEYMVCVGYATLLNDLLNKLGIESGDYSVTVDVGLDEVSNDALVLDDDVLIEEGFHERSIVHLVDPKYGIDGIYISDPTWDNVMKNDAYVHALMSQDEYNGMDRYDFVSFITVKEMYFVHSIDEFYEKANIWIDKKQRSLISTQERLMGNYVKDFQDKLVDFMSVLENVDKEKYDWFKMTYANLFSMSKPANNIAHFMERMENIVNEHNNSELSRNFKELMGTHKRIYSGVDSIRNSWNSAVIDFMGKMIDSIKNLDEEKYEELITKYGNPSSAKFNFEMEMFRDFMLDIGEYIVSRVNKEIPGETIIEALREMYLRTQDLSFEELDAKMEDIVEYNRKRHEVCFPTRYKVLEDGTKIPILNEHNKFDIEKGLGI